MKKSIKKIAQSLRNSARPTYVVSSCGRSGSTVVWDAIRKSLARSEYPLFGGLGVRMVSEEAWYPSAQRLMPGVVYKTHSLPCEFDHKKPIKAVFLFGRASDAVISVLSCEKRYGKEWIKRHLEHLGAQGDFSEILEKDILRIERQIDDWTSNPKIQTLSLKYDRLWEHESAIREFTELSIELPKRKERVSSEIVSAEIIEKVKVRYRDLDERIDRMPSFIVSEAPS